MKRIAPSSLRGLRTFCFAARYESFKAAADALFITPSAVSQQIKNFEEELGLKLFKRSAREVALTEDGEALFDELMPLIDRIDEVIAEFRGTGRRKKSLRISVQPFFATEYFIPRLGEFTSKHPEIDIQVGTSDETAEKAPADADLAIRLFRKPPADMQADLLFPLRMIPAGSRDFRKKLKLKGNRIVSDFPLIVHETRPRAWTDWSEVAGIELPDDVRVTRVGSMIAAVRAAEQGIGAALVPVPIADQWFRQRTIVPLFDRELVADTCYYLVSPEDRAEDPTVQTLRDWIVERFAEQP